MRYALANFIESVVFFIEKLYIKKLDLRNSKDVTDIVYIQGDKQVYPLEIILTENNEPFAIPDGGYVYLSFMLPDGSVDRGLAQVLDAENGHIVYEVVGSEIAKTGVIEVSVDVSIEDSLLTFEQRLRIMVDGSIMPQGITPPASMQNWVREIEERVEEMESGGLPNGGTENQVLAKASNKTGDVRWADASSTAGGLPVGGETGQYLVKRSDTMFDAEWVNLDIDMSELATKDDLVAETQMREDADAEIKDIVSEITSFPEAPDDGNVYGRKNAEWIKVAIKGEIGEDGKSAYEIAVDNGFVGSELEWLASLAGSDGDDGDNGATFTPSVSATGDISWTNNKGLPNPTAQNIKGATGNKGDTGERGLQGVKGDTGLQGATGATGSKGEDGNDGADGATFIPSVSAAGDISWTNDSGLPNPSTTNIKGVKGDTGNNGTDGSKGDKGDKGDAFTYSDFTSTQLAALKGATGAQGVAGAVFTPSVSVSGTISWSNNGELPNPTSVNIKGMSGDNGSTFVPSVSPQGIISWTNNGGFSNPSPVDVKGASGANGSDGADGKTAYESALDGGYTGTEAAFYAALAVVSQIIISTQIRENVVLTQAAYDALVLAGTVVSSTAYDIIEA